MRKLVSLDSAALSLAMNGRHPLTSYAMLVLY